MLITNYEFLKTFLKIFSPRNGSDSKYYLSISLHYTLPVYKFLQHFVFAQSSIICSLLCLCEFLLPCLHQQANELFSCSNTKLPIILGSIEEAGKPQKNFKLGRAFNNIVLVPMLKVQI